MGGIKETLYLKAEQNVEVQSRDVTLGDLFAMECKNVVVIPRLKTVKIVKMPERGEHRFVVSIMKVISLIHEIYPELEIQNLGETDIIVTYESGKSRSKWLEKLEIAGITALTFVGAAFAIMTFNNDSGTTSLLSQIYELATGAPSNGRSILEFSYCAGVTIGILVFFNHFGKRRFSVDPTPIEVEMRLYERDIQTTVIEDYSRKGHEIDGGNSDSAGGHRS